MDSQNDKITIRLSWPAKELSPNWRGHWAKKAEAAKVYRYESFWRTLAITGSRRQWRKGKITITAYPPNKKRRDLDNTFASCKPAIDGLVDAGVFLDDSKIEYSINPWGDVVKGGLIVIEAEG